MRVFDYLAFAGRGPSWIRHPHRTLAPKRSFCGLEEVASLQARGVLGLIDFKAHWCTICQSVPRVAWQEISTCLVCSKRVTPSAISGRGHAGPKARFRWVGIASNHPGRAEVTEERSPAILGSLALASGPRAVPHTTNIAPRFATSLESLTRVLTAGREATIDSVGSIAAYCETSHDF